MAAQFHGDALHGQVRAVVDGAGRLVGITIDATVLRRPAGAVAEAILAAVTQAQSAAAAAAVPPDHQQLMAGVEADLAAADREADRRLAEFQSTVADLLRWQR